MDTSIGPGFEQETKVQGISLSDQIPGKSQWVLHGKIENLIIGRGRVDRQEEGRMSSLQRKNGEERKKDPQCVIWGGGGCVHDVGTGAHLLRNRKEWKEIA